MFLAMQQEKRPKQFQTARQLDVVPKIFILNSTIQCILHSAKKSMGLNRKKRFYRPFSGNSQNPRIHILQSYVIMFMIIGNTIYIIK